MNIINTYFKCFLHLYFHSVSLTHAYKCEHDDNAGTQSCNNSHTYSHAGSNVRAISNCLGWYNRTYKNRVTLCLTAMFRRDKGS